jgi:hypothetical protein
MVPRSCNTIGLIPTLHLGSRAIWADCIVVITHCQKPGLRSPLHFV